MPLTNSSIGRVKSLCFERYWPQADIRDAITQRQLVTQKDFGQDPNATNGSVAAG